MASDPSWPRTRGACPPLLGRIAAAALACTLAAAGTPARAAAAPDANEIERLYNEGSSRNANKNYSGAAESWTELLELMQENSANQSTRENVLLNVLDAYMNAYNGMRKADNTKDIQHLRNAQSVLTKYLGAWQSAYGRGKGVSSAVQEKANALDEMIKKAEEEDKAPPPVDPNPKETPTNGETDKPPPPPPIQLPPEKNGIGLIAGGAVMLGVGVGSLALIIVGGVRGPKYEKDFERANAGVQELCGDQDEAVCYMGLDMTQQAQLEQLVNDRDDAEKKGKQANALTIAGAVIAPLLIAGGATMLAFGIKRNREAKAASRPNATFQPTVSPRFTGFVIQGRF
jgi:hypothetical protein